MVQKRDALLLDLRDRRAVLWQGREHPSMDIVGWEL